MGTTFKLILFYVNVSAIVLAVVVFGFSIVKLIIHKNDEVNWVVVAAISLAAIILLGVIFNIRKSKIPAPGKDYL